MEGQNGGLLLFLECPTHSSSSLNLVCIDARCTKQGLICHECKDADHTHHNIVVLRDFVNKSKQIARSMEHGHPIIQRIDQIKKSVGKSFQATKQTIVSTLDNVERQVIEALDRVRNDFHQRFVGERRRVREIPKFDYKITQDYGKVLDQVRQAVKNYRVHDSENSEVNYEMQMLDEAQKKRQKILDDLKNNLNFRVKEINRISSTDLDDSVDDIILMTHDREDKPKEFKSHYENVSEQKASRRSENKQDIERPLELKKRIAWSSKFKHSTITLENKRVARSTWKDKQQSAGILANRVVNLAPPFVHIWYVNILKQTSVIDIGICLQDLAKQNNFVYGNWTLNGHGNFTMSSQGRCYSSIDNTLHKSSNKLLYFTSNDKIRVEYHVNENRLRFTKISPQGNEYSTQIRVQRVSKYQKFRPCVYFIGEDNCVQLSESAD